MWLDSNAEDYTEEELLEFLRNRLMLNSRAVKLEVLYEDGSHDTFKYVRPSAGGVISRFLSSLPSGPWDPDDAAAGIVSALEHEDLLK
jgi:hypothetical protein